MVIWTHHTKIADRPYMSNRDHIPISHIIPRSYNAEITYYTEISASGTVMIFLSTLCFELKSNCPSLRDFGQERHRRLSKKAVQCSFILSPLTALSSSITGSVRNKALLVRRRDRMIHHSQLCALLYWWVIKWIIIISTDRNRSCSLVCDRAPASRKKAAVSIVINAVIYLVRKCV